MSQRVPTMPVRKCQLLRLRPTLIAAVFPVVQHFDLDSLAWPVAKERALKAAISTWPVLLCRRSALARPDATSKAAASAGLRNHRDTVRLLAEFNAGLAP